MISYPTGNCARINTAAVSISLLRLARVIHEGLAGYRTERITRGAYFMNATRSTNVEW